MAKLCRRAWGWVGTGERRSRMRRTSRGPSRLPRRLRKTASGGLSGPARAGRPSASHRPSASAPRSWIGHPALLVPLPQHGDRSGRQVDTGRGRARRARPPEGRRRRGARARRRRAARRPRPERVSGGSPASAGRATPPARDGRAPSGAVRWPRAPRGAGPGRWRQRPGAGTRGSRSAGRPPSGPPWPGRSGGWPGTPGTGGARPGRHHPAPRSRLARPSGRRLPRRTGRPRLVSGERPRNQRSKASTSQPPGRSAAVRVAADAVPLPIEPEYRAQVARSIDRRSFLAHSAAAAVGAAAVGTAANCSSPKGPWERSPTVRAATAYPRPSPGRAAH